MSHFGGSVVTLVQPLHHLESGSDLSSREIVSFNEESTAAFMHKNCQLKLDNDSGCGSVTTTQTLESAESDNFTSLSSSIETDSQQDGCSTKLQWDLRKTASCYVRLSKSWNRFLEQCSMSTTSYSQRTNSRWTIFWWWIPCILEWYYWL